MADLFDNDAPEPGEHTHGPVRLFHGDGRSELIIEGVPVILDKTYRECDKCKKLKPLAKFGGRWVSARQEFRFQPRCNDCER